MGVKFSKLTPYQSGELLKLFVAGSPARTAAALAGVHRNTAALFFSTVRAVIAAHQERAMAQAFDGPVEIDESYFGGHRKGKRGRGAAGKVAVFGVPKRGGRVYAQMIADGGRATLVPIIRRKVAPAGVVYFRLVVGLRHPVRRGVRASAGQPRVGVGVRRGRPAHQRDRERLESGQAAPATVHGVPKGSFPLFLQECG